MDIVSKNLEKWARVLYFLKAPQVIQICESILTWRWVSMSSTFQSVHWAKAPSRESRHVGMVCQGLPCAGG